MVWMNGIGEFVGVGDFLAHLAQHGVVVAINETSVGRNHIGENLELLDVDVKGREHIDMVPGNTADDTHIGLVEVEFRSAVNGGGQVFVAFDDHDFRAFAEFYHDFKTGQLGTNHVVAIDTILLQHMDNHGGDGGFAVAATHHDTALVLALLIEKFRIGEYPYS